MARLAGAGGAWPAWIVRAASATPSTSASATGGSSWSCVHSPLKACRAGFSTRCRDAKFTISGAPDFRFHWLRQALTTLAHSHFSCGALSTDSVTPVHYQISQLSRLRSGGMANSPCGIAGWAGCNRERNRDRPLSGEANSYWRKNLLNFCVFGYPLSESVAPPGTAWGAEGLRGNEANENNLMVLAPVEARKGQSGGIFAQEAMTVRLRVSRG